jgi:bifunctional non-homologous end joining protein LigD
MGLEGIVSKQQDAPYRSGRVESWIKVKCGKRDTFPIVAFVEKLGAKPRKIASLYVGRREGDKLLYAGKVRSGYTEAVARTCVSGSILSYSMTHRCPSRSTNRKRPG